MHCRYVIEAGRVRIPWRANGMLPEAQLRVRLLARAVAPVPEPVAEWWFGSIDADITALEVDLWHIDLYSVQFDTTAGLRLAHDHTSTPCPRLSGSAGLEVAAVSGIDAYLLLAAELVLSEDERRGVSERTRRSRVPTIEWFFLELTNRCNFACAWCPKEKMRRRTGAMSLEQAQALLDQIAAYRRRYPLHSLYAELRHPVFLHVMGEPLLHPDWFEIVRYGKEQTVDFCLVTNASLLHSETIDRVLESGISSVVLSLNAPDAASFRATGTKISYEYVVGQAQALIAERYRRGLAAPRIEIQLLNSTGVDAPGWRLVENYTQVQAQLAYWSRFARRLEREYGVVAPVDDDPPQRWTSILGHHQANHPETYIALGQNISLVFKQTCNFANALVRQGSSIQETQQGRCPFRNAHRVLCVFWDGSCSFCSMDYNNDINLGNVFDQGIEAIWAGERMSRIRALMDYDILSEPLCRRCLGRVVPPPLADIERSYS